MAAKAKKEAPLAEPFVLEKASSDVIHPRMLIVEFVGDAPKIKFMGDWSVRHLLTIKRCISREFKLHRRDVIRNTITT